MSLRTIKADTTNRGGIYKEHRNGVNFRLMYELDGEFYDVVYNDSDESVPSYVRSLGLTRDEVLVERIW